MCNGRCRRRCSLHVFALGRLHSTGRVDAGVRGRGVWGPARLGRARRGLDARTVSPRLRVVSRALGRQLLRSGQRVWPERGARRVAGGVAAGRRASSAGARCRRGAARARRNRSSHRRAASSRIDGRDLGLAAARARSLRCVLAVGGLGADHRRDRRASGRVRCTIPSTHCPPRAAPLVEILAEDHATWEVRLFAS